MKLDDLLKKYADGKCTAEEENAVRKWLTTHVADPAYDKVFENLLYNRKNEMCRVRKRNAIVLIENEM